MGALILDASAALRVVLDDASATGLIEVIGTSYAVYAPTLFVVETANALWKYIGGGHIAEESAVRLHKDSLRLVDRFIADDELLPEALTVASRMGHPVYDVLYAIAARRTAAALLTCDKRLAQLARKLEIEIAEPTR